MARNDRSPLQRRIAASILVAFLAGGLAGCDEALAHNGEIHRPADAEFGFGPRASGQRIYTATLEPAQALRLRSLQTVAVRIVDAEGRPVEGATIAVAGGMPEHAHGLPTQPRVTASKGNGVYEIEGVRFSMGGWWELKLSIESPAGADAVTFNLSL